MENLSSAKTNKVYNFFDFVRIPFKACPICVLTICSIHFFSALLPTFIALITARFVEVILLIYSGEAEKTAIVAPLLLYSVMIVFSFFKDVILGNFINIKFELDLQKYFRTIMLEKKAKICYRYIENNESWELINRTGNNVTESIISGFNTILNIAEVIAQVLMTLMIIYTQVWWTALAIVIVLFAFMKLSIYNGKNIYEADKNAENKRRRSNYFKLLMIDRNNVEERSLFAYTSYLLKRWHYIYEDSRKTSMKAELKRYIVERCGSVIVLLMNLLIQGILLFALARGRMSVGIFIGIQTPLTSLVETITWRFSSIVNELTKSRLYLKDMSKFMSMPECDGALDKPVSNIIKVDKIVFDKVSFKYPGTTNYVLKNFSLELFSNKKYAIVGENGAGKSTLVKILTGLYDDYEGNIYINNIELRNYKQADLKRIFSIAYQDYSKFQISIRDNIKIGDVSRLDIADDDNVFDLIREMGIDDLLHNANKLDTKLGKLETDSSELSGGQWQKLALARALYGEKSIYILDEPTSSIDPISESQFYESFGKLCINKLVIFITHRLGAAKMADEILVINDGRVCQKGTHEELLEQNGQYFMMYEAQRSWYIKNEKKD